MRSTVFACARRWRGAARWLAASALVGATAAVGCNKKDEGAAGGQMPPTDVTFVTVAPTTIPVNYEFQGVTEASQTVDLRARVKGFLLDWRKNFTEGRVVTTRPVLFEIDPREYQVDLDIARAKLEAAEARLKRVSPDVVRLRAAAGGGAAAQRELDVAVAEELQAKADVNEMTASIAAKQLSLDWTRVRAPFDGLIGKAQKDPGSYVDTDANGMLATVWQLDPIHVYFTFSERDYVQWRQDVDAGRVLVMPGGVLNIEFKLIDGTDYPYAGTLNFSDVRIDPQTGSARLRATFANPPVQTPDGPEYSLKPGQAVRGRIIGWQRPGVFVVPQAAVVQGGTGASVFTIGADGSAEMRPVATGEWLEGGYWVINRGLKEGDRVVVDGGLKIGFAMMSGAPKVMLNPKPAPPVNVPAVRATTKPTTAPTTMPTSATMMTPSTGPAATPPSTGPATK